jgi:hypothetical protein
MIGGAGSDYYYADHAGDIVVETNVSTRMTSGQRFVGPIASSAIATLNGAGGSDTADFSGFGAAVWASLSRPDVWTRDTNNVDTGARRQFGNPISKI